MLSVEEFKNKLNVIKDNANVDRVGQPGSSYDAVKLVEDNCDGNGLKCFTIDFDKYTSDLLTKEQFIDILDGIPFASLSQNILVSSGADNISKSKLSTDLLKWIVVYSNEHLWDYCKIDIRYDGVVSEFLIYGDCKSISKIPITYDAGDNLEIHYMNSKVCAFVVNRECELEFEKIIYYILPTNANLYDGLKELPYYAKFYKGMVLKDCMVYSSFVASEENDYKLMVDGTVTIISENPIITFDHVTISGVPGSKLILSGMSSDQPCIGSKTNTGLSYGRWEPATKCPKEICIDTVEVECQSANLAFSIGAYGWEEIPKVVCVNGGKLICPEMKGTRILRKHGNVPNGSTKRISDPVYEIIKNGDTPISSLSTECKLIYR